MQLQGQVLKAALGLDRQKDMSTAGEVCAYDALTCCLDSRCCTANYARVPEASTQRTLCPGDPLPPTGRLLVLIQAMRVLLL